jgi:outer membrane protein assembly factor BamA
MKAYPMTGRPHPSLVFSLGLIVGGLFCGVSASRAESLGGPDVPVVRPISDQLSALSGKLIVSVEVVSKGTWFRDSPQLRWAKAGDPFSLAYVRSAVRDLLDSGRIGGATIEALPQGEGVAVKIVTDPRRVISQASVVSSPLPTDEVLSQLGLRAGGEIVDSELVSRVQALERFHAERGYPKAKVSLSVLLTDDPMAVVLLFTVEPGPPSNVVHRRFEVAPDPNSPGLTKHLLSYGVANGERFDEPRLTRADRELTQTLRHEGWLEAVVSHVAEVKDEGASVRVQVRSGPKVSIAFEGNLWFDHERLFEVLEWETNEDRSIDGMAERLRRYYLSFGFFDAKVIARVVEPSERERRVTFAISEGELLRVSRREYPCLTGGRTASELNAEVDSFLAEELPGAEVLGPVDPELVDASLGPKGVTGARPSPLRPNPYETYSPRVYERALKHLQDLYRSEGYLSATAGPAQLVRRACAKGSPPGECRPIAANADSAAACRRDELDLPLDEPGLPATLSCSPDRKRGLECETSATLRIPIKLGPLTLLWDVAFEGNQRLTESQLGKVAELDLGEPLSLAEVEQARRRVLDEYIERGFAYADVATQIEQSPNHGRARVRFSVREGEQVKVGAILIRGARITSESLIRSRVALETGKSYRQSLVRATEERLANLGVLTTVRVGLEDPYVPAREKNVIIEVAERVPQYFEGQPGFSTGEGARARLEFGHLNVAGKAVQFALRVRMSYLPDALILEPEVRSKYQAEVSEVRQRLERTLGLSLTFPDVGLGPLFRLGVEAFDVHDNARDYALTKDAAVVNLSHFTTRRLTLQFGGSVERNKVQIFGSSEADQPDALKEFVQNNQGLAALFRVPAGTTAAIAERFTVSWDRRDMPLNARRGTFVTGSVEHVTARPLSKSSSSSDNPFVPTDSEFLRWTGRAAGYVPLSKKGTTLALSFRLGLNHQLTSGSRTYPDRLFFVGGMDTVRGFLQDSMIPEDIAYQLLDKSARLTVDSVLVRGGNFFVNPRAELRLPVRGSFETALFVDAGNLWSRSPTEPEVELTDEEIANRAKVYRPNYLRLRYAFGTGLRFQTPIGPLVFDYGFNVERVLDAIMPKRENKRTWEDLGAFHFSIGLF